MLFLFQLGFFAFYGLVLFVQGLACSFKFVACASVFALLLVKLQFALFLLGFHGLNLGHALVGGFFGLGRDFECFLAAFYFLIFLDVESLTLGIGHDLSCAVLGGRAVYHYCDDHSYGGGNDGDDYGCY